MLADLLFPKKCLRCGSGGNYVCKKCIGKQYTKPQRCLACEKNSIDGAVSIWVYEGVVRKALVGLKYKFAGEIAKELATVSVCFLRENFNVLPRNTILIPVPLHKRRENWRGFNQSERMGKLISEKMGWKFIPDMVVRKAKTTPQTELKRTERKANLVGVFEFNRLYSHLIDRYPITIFDDVCTTGTTLKEVAKVLKRVGFEKVWGLTLAR